MTATDVKSRHEWLFEFAELELDSRAALFESH